MKKPLASRNCWSHISEWRNLPKREKFKQDSLTNMNSWLTQFLLDSSALLLSFFTQLQYIWTEIVWKQNDVCSCPSIIKTAASLHYIPKEIEKVQVLAQFKSCMFSTRVYSHLTVNTWSQLRSVSVWDFLRMKPLRILYPELLKRCSPVRPKTWTIPETGALQAMERKRRKSDKKSFGFFCI